MKILGISSNDVKFDQNCISGLDEIYFSRRYQNGEDSHLTVNCKEVSHGGFIAIIGDANGHPTLYLKSYHDEILENEIAGFNISYITSCSISNKNKLNITLPPWSQITIISNCFSFE